MQINFYPEQNNPEFEKAAEEYGKIWENEGDKIIEVIEKISGLKFKEKIVNAIVYGKTSWAYPLTLQADLSIQHKGATLIHELCHRLMRGNNLEPKIYTAKNTHKQIYLIYFDILCDLYGEKFAEEEVKFELTFWKIKKINPHRIAWDWALSMTREERRKIWKKSLEK